ncbi:MAG: DUF167 domain-containing protein [Candidatus Thorarchaeota archaeon]
MKFLEKVRDYSYKIHINVKPNSKRQAIINDGEFLTIFLRSKAIQNKANRELIILLRKKLEISSKQIQIISGLRSSTKLVKINFFDALQEKELNDKLLKEKS